MYYFIFLLINIFVDFLVSDLTSNYLLLFTLPFIYYSLDFSSLFYNFYYLINLDTPNQMFTFVGGVLISKEIAHMRVPGNFSLNFYFVQNLSYFKLLYWVDIHYFLFVLFVLHFYQSQFFFMTYIQNTLINSRKDVR
jgi:hypothetical protein